MKKNIFCALTLLLAGSIVFSQEADSVESEAAQPEVLSILEVTEQQTEEAVSAVTEEPVQKTVEIVKVPEILSSQEDKKEIEEVPVHNVTITAEESIEYIEDLKSQILSARANNETDKEKKLTKVLSKAYSQLETKTFAALSVTNELSFQVFPFDAKDESWKIVISSELFNQTSLFNQIIDLPWEAMSGSSLSKIEKMSSREYAAYASQVIMYDDMLISEKPNIALNLTYLIKPWNGASEYRFIPLELQVIRTDYNNQVIYTLEDSDFNSASFSINPGLEIRNYNEISKDMAKNEKYLQKETNRYNKKHPSVGTVKLPEQSYKKAAREAEKDRKPVIQKGRGSATINFVDHETNEDFQDFSKDNIWLDNINGTITLGLGKYSFFLFDVGGQAKEQNKNEYLINFGAGFGLSVNILNFLRPYCYVAEDYLTTRDAVTKLSAGIDVVFGNIFVITAAYGYNFLTPIGNYDINKSFIGNMKQYHSFSVGTGFSW